MISTDYGASKFESIEDDASLVDAVPQAQIERSSLARAVYISIQNTNVPTSLSPIMRPRKERPQAIHQTHPLLHHLLSIAMLRMIPKARYHHRLPVVHGKFMKIL